MKEISEINILVVDDEIAALNTFLPHIIDEININCKMFMNEPFAALEYAKAVKIDAAFLDIVMLQINGVELAQKLIEINGDTEIIFISGYAQDESVVSEKLGDNLIGFCYKPYEEQQIKNLLLQIRARGGKTPEVEIRAFNGFDVFINGAAVRFPSSKSKELLALIVDKNGGHLSMGEAITYLWPEKSPEHSKRLYRDAVCRLRLLLKNYGIENLVSFNRAILGMNRTGVKCDLWEFLAGGDSSCFNGSYMPQYDWSIETQSMLETIAEKRNGGL